MTRRWWYGIAVLVTLGLVSCQLVLDMEERVYVDGDEPACVPGTTMPCYSGPANTEGVGTCHAGTATCHPDGSGFGVCEGEVLPAVEDCSTPLNESCRPACGDHIWIRAFENVGVGSRGLTTDTQGNLIWTGYFDGPVDFGGGIMNAGTSRDIFVLKFDPSGNHMWSQAFGSTGGGSGSAVAVDALGNMFITGHFQGDISFPGVMLTSAGNEDIFVMKLGPTGTPLWSKRFGGGGKEGAYGIALDKSENVLVAGSFQGNVSFGSYSLSSIGSQDGFVVKLSSLGDVLWAKSVGASGNDAALDVAMDESNNAVVTGFFGGAMLPSPHDIIVFKFDPAGDVLWSKGFSAGEYSTGYTVAMDESDGALITGHFTGSVDFGGGLLVSGGSRDVFLLRVDSDGNHSWSVNFGSAWDDEGVAGLVMSGATNAIVTGYFRGSFEVAGKKITNSGSYDVFVLELDAANSYRWFRRYGGSGSELGVSIALSSGDSLFVAGSFSGMADLGDGPLSMAGGGGAFLMKLAR